MAQSSPDVFLTMGNDKPKDDDGFEPISQDEADDFHPLKAPSNEDNESFLSRIWKTLNTAPKAITDLADTTATKLTNPSLNPNPDIPTGIGTNTIGLDKLKGFAAGAMQGASKLLTPINIASALLPELRASTDVIAPLVSKAAGIGSRLIGGMQGVEGGERVLHGNTLGEKGQGALEGSLGLLGIREPKLNSTEVPIMDEGTNYLKPNDFMDSSQNRPDLSSQYTPGNRKLLQARPEGNRFVDSPSDGTFDLHNQNQLEEFNRGKLRTPGTSIPIEERPLNQTGVRSKTIENYRDRSLNQKFSDVAKKLFSEEEGSVNHKTLLDSFKRLLGSDDPKDIRRGIQVRIGQLDARGVGDIEYRKLLPKELADIPLSKNESYRSRLINGMNRVASPNQVPGTVPASDSAIDTLMEAIRNAIPMREAQEKSYSAEKGARFSRAEDVTKVGMAGYKERLGHLAGKYKKLEYEPVKIDQKNTDKLINLIWNNPDLKFTDKLSASSGLSKILGVTKEKMLPQRKELENLGKVLGSQNIDEITNLYAGIGGLPGKITHELVNVPKTLEAFMDLSAPFRQGIGVVHTKEFWKNLVPMTKMFGNEELYQATMESIKEHPNFEMAKDAGLDLGKLTQSPREEQVFTKLLEGIPGIKASDRAFSGFLDKTRFDVFNRMVKDGSLENEPWTREHLADYINNATGKGSLGSLEKHADLLNTVFYSPRLISSRAQMAGKIFDPNIPNSIRKEYIKSLLAVASFGTMLGQISKLGGAEVNGDPTNSDFGKIRIGNTRIDPFGGFVQFAVLLSRLVNQEKTSSFTGKTSPINKGNYGGATTLSTVQDFARTKMSPVAGYIYDAMKGTTPSGQKFSYAPEAINRVVPLIANDMWELVQSDPDLILGGAAALASVFGMGVSTYGANDIGHSISGQLGLGNNSNNNSGMGKLNPVRDISR